MSAIQDIIAFAAASHVIPAPVTQDALRHLRDTLAVGIAGSSAPGAEGVRKTMLLAGDTPQCRVLGTDWKLPAPAAAFCNTFQIHCLEWDAVHEPAVVHALSVVSGALLAIADRRADVTEDDFLSALCVGVDIACGIGLSSKSPMRFFRPATAGLLGAALACARLEKMSEAQMRDVIGLAYSQASGTMQAHSEGTIALPVQVAVAARAAITAVDLVKNGLAGPHDVLEGSFGFFRLIEPEYDLAEYHENLGKKWRITEISTKPFPTGRASHGTLATLQQLQETQKFHASDVEDVKIYLPPLAHRLVARPMKTDMTTAYARLCLPFLGALMLREGRIDPRKFTASSFADPDIQMTAAKFAAFRDDNPNVNALMPQRIVVRLSNGQTYDIPVAHVSGSPLCPLTPPQAAAKFATCLDLALVALSETQRHLLQNNPLAYAISGHAA